MPVYGRSEASRRKHAPPNKPRKGWQQEWYRRDFAITPCGAHPEGARDRGLASLHPRLMLSALRAYRSGRNDECPGTSRRGPASLSAGAWPVCFEVALTSNLRRTGERERGKGRVFAIGDCRYGLNRRVHPRRASDNIYYVRRKVLQQPPLFARPRLNTPTKVSCSATRCSHPRNGCPRR